MKTTRTITSLCYGLSVAAILSSPFHVRAGFPITAIDGTIQLVPDITTDATWGGAPQMFNMEGMEVTAFFDGGAPETAIWQGGAPFPPDGGGAIGASNWQLENLTQGIHTIGSPWTLSYGGSPKGNLIGFEIDGLANVVNPEDGVGFDRVSPNSGSPVPNPGTAGSSWGRDFEGGINLNGKVTYRNAIDSMADAHVGPVRDLYRILNVEFDEQNEPKWEQGPVENMGWNVHSDIDWRTSMNNPDRQAIADDFVSDGRPITAVRWWGSYFDPEQQPQLDPESQTYTHVEEAFLLSFFHDAGGVPQPGPPAGSYIAPIENVAIQPLEIQGWDQHPIWQYEVELVDTFLDHADDPIATPEAFLEEAGVEYWLSIAAENGHAIDPETGDSVDTQDEPTTRFWGWHTIHEPIDVGGFIDDQPFQTNIFMPAEHVWEYGDWVEASPDHDGVDGPFNMTFDLLTTSSIRGLGAGDSFVFYQDTDNMVPEPSSNLLMALGLTLGIAFARRKRC